ncbi:putative sugar O-methyltransferase [Candidatus Thioglobus sp.]|nr:putative sugar O-methyltransferase [Candidatus Thioglobus sp.]
MTQEKIDLFIKNSSSFYKDDELDNIDNKHKGIIEKAYKQFSESVNLANLKNWAGQSDMTVPPQLSFLQFKHRGIFKVIVIYFAKLILRREEYKLLKSTLLDDIAVIKSKENGSKLLADNPVHLTPGSNIFYQHEGTTVNGRWLRYVYQLQQIKSNKLLNDNQIWVDVGSYYGGLAGLVKKYFSDIRIILVDFHHQLCRSYLYLSELYPEVEHIFPDSITQYKNFKDIPNGSIMYVPVSEYDSIQDNQVDFFTNSFSLGEMRREVFNSYVNSPLYQQATNLYLINRFVSAPFFEQTYDTDLNILDYKLYESNVTYFDMFPIHHYMLLKRKVLGRIEFRNVSSPYFEVIINQGQKNEK